MENRNGASPVVPTPSEGSTLPGQSSPVYPGDGGAEDHTPLIPLPNPGEGGPVYPGDDVPLTPTPSNPSVGRPPTASMPSVGGGIAVQPLPDYTITVPTRYAAVRFLNATHGYPPFRIFVDGTRVVNLLNAASASGYVRIPAGVRRIAAAGQDGYVYIAKELPFVSGSTSTVAIVNRTGGLELAQIADACRVI